MKLCSVSLQLYQETYHREFQMFSAVILIILVLNSLQMIMFQTLYFYQIIKLLSRHIDKLNIGSFPIKEKGPGCSEKLRQRKLIEWFLKICSMSVTIFKFEPPYLLALRPRKMEIDSILPTNCLTFSKILIQYHFLILLDEITVQPNTSCVTKCTAETETLVPWNISFSFI